MSSLRAIGSLLARRFSPRAQAQAPGTRGSAAGRPARFLHSLRSLAACGAVVAAAATCSGFAFLHLKKEKDADESAGEKARKEVTDEKRDVRGDRKAGHEATGSEPLKEQRDMEAEFEDWMKKYGKTYRYEEEKAMRGRICGISPPDEEYYEFLQSRPEFIDYHKELAGKA